MRSFSSISVIIPAYNAEKYIGEAIESALNQTRPAKEIVVVDDASTDRTAEIARSFGERVTVLRNAVNRGPGHSRNAGVTASTGEYLAFLDADDKWLPEHLGDLAGLLDRWSEAGFAISSLRKFGVRREGICQFQECVFQPTNIFLRLMRRDALLPSASMVRKADFLSVDGFSEIVEFRHGRRVQVEDYDFFLRLSVHSLCIASSEATALYRTHQEQASVLLTEQTLMAFKYRMRLTNQMKTMPDDQETMRLGIDQMRHAWEGHLRDAWKKINQKKLRAMVRWGLDQPPLADSCSYYRVRAMLSPWVVRLGRWKLQKNNEWMENPYV